MNRHIGEEKIALLAGNDLDAGEAAVLQGHISECPSCAAVLAGYRGDRSALAAFREAGVGQGDFDRVRQSVLERLPDEKAGRFRLNAWLPFRWPQWGGLAALILVAAALGFWWRSGKLVTPTAQVAVPPVAAAVERPQTTAGKSSRPEANQAAVRTAARAQAVPSPRPAPPTTARNLPADAGTDSQLIAPAQPPVVPDDIVMKLETSDPNVIIIWLASPKGAGR